MTREEIIERLQSIVIGHSKDMLFSQKLALREAIAELESRGAAIMATDTEQQAKTIEAFIARCVALNRGRTFTSASAAAEQEWLEALEAGAKALRFLACDRPAETLPTYWDGLTEETGFWKGKPDRPAETPPHGETVAQARDAVFSVAHAYGWGDAYNSNLYNTIDALIASVRAEAAPLNFHTLPPHEPPQMKADEKHAVRQLMALARDVAEVRGSHADHQRRAERILESITPPPEPSQEK